MKRKAFILFLVCAVSVMLFTGCDRLGDEEWTDEIATCFAGLMTNDSGIKNIDSAHRDAFDSVFSNIEIFGARLCVPMKVSELPDKFELSSSFMEYVSPSEEDPTELNGGLKRYRLKLYYDKEVCVAGISVICEKDQSIEEGIIYEIEFGVLYYQPALLGGKVEIRSDIDDIKEFLGEGNAFYDVPDYTKSEFCELFYTDGNRMIELTYGISGEDTTFLMGSVRTYNDYGTV